jgi:hypothetical protein
MFMRPTAAASIMIACRVHSWLGAGFLGNLTQLTSTKISDACEHLYGSGEPPGIWWRLQLLREWSYEQEAKQIFAGSPGTGCPSGTGAAQ